MEKGLSFYLMLSAMLIMSAAYPQETVSVNHSKLLQQTGGATEACQLPLEINVSNPTNHIRKQFPVTIDCKLQANEWLQPKALVLKDARNQQITCQAKILSHWPDKSVREFRLDFLDNFKPKEIKRYVLSPGNSAPPPADYSNWIQEDSTRLEINTGPIKIQISKIKFSLFEHVFYDLNQDQRFTPDESVLALPEFLIRLNGQDYRNLPNQTQVQAIEKGPLKCTVTVLGRLQNKHKENAVNYRMQIVAYVGQPFIQLIWKAEFREVETGSIIPGDSIQNSISKIQYSFQTPAPAKYCSFRARQELHTFPVKDWLRIIRERTDFYKVASQTATIARGERIENWANFSLGKSGLSVVVENSWKDCPVGFLVQGNQIIAYHWPPQAGLLAFQDLKRHTSDKITLYFHPAEHGLNQVGELMTSFLGANPHISLGKKFSQDFD